MKLLGFLLCIFLCSEQVFAQTDAAENGSSWWNGNPWENPERGFNWYPPDRPPEKKKEKVELKHTPIKQLKTMEELQAELTRLKNVAIMEPTEQNVKVYLEAQTYVLDKGSLFADTARRVVWQNPEVDYNNRNPTASFAVLDKKDMREQQRNTAMATLSKDYGLMFFFREDCTYCHSQAPILKLLQNNYRFPVMAVSLDGGRLAQFPNAKKDNGISLILTDGQGITVTPAIYLVHRETKQAVLLGTGALAMDDLVDRIYVLTQTRPGQEF